MTTSVRAVGQVVVWTIGDQRVEAALLNVGAIAVYVDGEMRIAMAQHQLGEWSVPLAKPDVRFRRVRNIDTAATELWIGAVRTPPIARHAARRLASDRATCEAHAGSTAYRAEPVVATHLCVVCEQARCAACFGPDDARCQPCFALATDAYDRALRMQRSRGLIIALVLVGLTMIAGLVLGQPRLFGIGGSGLVLIGLTFVVGRAREKREAKQLGQIQPETRAKLQHDGEALARALRGNVPLREEEPQLPLRIEPPEHGHHLARAIGHSPRGRFVALASAGEAIPTSIEIAAVPSTEGRREIVLELATLAEGESEATPLVAFRAIALRPLAADDSVCFSLRVQASGAFEITATDERSDVKLRVERLDDGTTTAPVA